MVAGRTFELASREAVKAGLLRCDGKVAIIQYRQRKQLAVAFQAPERYIAVARNQNDRFYWLSTRLFLAQSGRSGRHGLVRHGGGVVASPSMYLIGIQVIDRGGRR